MQSPLGWYDPALLAAVRGYFGGEAAARKAGGASISIALADLAPGMVLRSNIETRDGTLIVCAGHHLNKMTLEKIKNFAFVARVREPLLLEIPESSDAPTDA